MATVRAPLELVLDPPFSPSPIPLHNAHGGPISPAKICSVKDVSYNTKDERATLSLTQPIPAGDAVLAIKFTGVINNAMAGFYRAKYKPAVTPAASTAKDAEHHYMLSTQFEACDARRAFPCFDEPNLKASFEFEIEIPEDQVALSNMPEKAVTKGSKDGFKKVSFEKTPAMSTYVSSAGPFYYEFLGSLINLLACCMGCGRL
jgi:aminopeptidase N